MLKFAYVILIMDMQYGKRYRLESPMLLFVQMLLEPEFLNS